MCYEFVDKRFLMVFIAALLYCQIPMFRVSRWSYKSKI